MLISPNKMQSSRSFHGAETLQQAFEEFRSKLPSTALEQLQPYLISGQTTKMLDHNTFFDQMMKLDNLRHRVDARGSLKAFLSLTERMGRVVDTFVGASPAFTLLIWGSMKLVFLVSNNSTHCCAAYS